MKSLGERYTECLRRWVEHGAEPFLTAEVEALGAQLDEQGIPWASVEEMHAHALERVGEACPAVPLATAAPRIADFLLEVGRARLVARRLRLRSEPEEAVGGRFIDDEFVSLLVHELRNPLGPILAWSDLLREGDVDGEAPQAEALETIVRNGKLLGGMVDNVGVALRSPAALREVRLEPIDLVPLLTETADTFEQLAGSKGITLQRTWGRVLPVLGEARTLRQVLGNLVDNAVKFTSAGGTVEIVGEAHEDRVLIEVRDSGCGIPAAELEGIFEQDGLGAESTTRHRGLGLGLTATRRLVELHGGSVAAQSEGEDRGAVFSLELAGAPLGHVVSEEDLVDAPHEEGPDLSDDDGSETAESSGGESDDLETVGEDSQIQSSGTRDAEADEEERDLPGTNGKSPATNGLGHGNGETSGMSSVDLGIQVPGESEVSGDLLRHEDLADDDNDEEYAEDEDSGLDVELPEGFWDDDEDDEDEEGDEVPGVDERLLVSRLWNEENLDEEDPWSEGGVEADSEGTQTVPEAESGLPDGYPGEEVAGEERELDGVRILVVDDEPDATRATSALLKRWGATVCETHSAEEALGELTKFRPGLLISDIAMPQHDGYALLVAVRRHEDSSGIHRLPAIALTVHSRESERRKALSAGFDAVVSKPIESSELLETLELLLDQE